MAVYDFSDEELSEPLKRNKKKSLLGRREPIMPSKALFQAPSYEEPWKTFLKAQVAKWRLLYPFLENGQIIGKLKMLWRKKNHRLITTPKKKPIPKKARSVQLTRFKKINSPRRHSSYNRIKSPKTVRFQSDYDSVIDQEDVVPVVSQTLPRSQLFGSLGKNYGSDGEEAVSPPRRASKPVASPSTNKTSRVVTAPENSDQDTQPTEPIAKKESKSRSKKPPTVVPPPESEDDATQIYEPPKPVAKKRSKSLPEKDASLFNGSPYVGPPNESRHIPNIMSLSTIKQKLEKKPERKSRKVSALSKVIPVKIREIEVDMESHNSAAETEPLPESVESVAGTSEVEEGSVELTNNSSPEISPVETQDDSTQIYEPKEEIKKPVQKISMLCKRIRVPLRTVPVENVGGGDFVTPLTTQPKSPLNVRMRDEGLDGPYMQRWRNRVARNLSLERSPAISTASTRSYMSASFKSPKCS